MKANRSTPVQRLVAAMDRCAIARGEANWTNGYRSASVKTNPVEHERLYAKEQLQWRRVGDVEKAFKRLAQRVVRDAQRSQRRK